MNFDNLIRVIGLGTDWEKSSSNQAKSLKSTPSFWGKNGKYKIIEFSTTSPILYMQCSTASLSVCIAVNQVLCGILRLEGAQFEAL